jgi:hypothetical protein
MVRATKKPTAGLAVGSMNADFGLKNLQASSLPAPDHDCATTDAVEGRAHMGAEA